MHRRQPELRTAFFVALAAAAAVVGAGAAPPAHQAATVRDAIWIWGNPEMTVAGAEELAEYAQCSPARRAALLGGSNVILAGAGLPSDRELAARWTADVSHCRELIWEILPDGQNEWQAPFVFEQRLDDLVPLVRAHPQIRAVLVDDMTSVAASRGFQPDHLAAIKDGLRDRKLDLELWGVVYTMNLDRPGIAELIEPLDVVLLAEWHAAEVPNLAANVERARELAPGKPIVLGLYLHDYGGSRPFPQDLLEQQFETALRLLTEGRIAGIEITTIDNDEAAIHWAAEWIRAHGDRELKAAGNEAPAKAD